jgi:monoterpene epsilon-lactone hydrolase
MGGVMTSLRSRIVHRGIQGIGRTLAKGLSIQEMRAGLETLSQRGGSIPKGVIVTTITVSGIPAEWIEPIDGNSDKVLLYLHGGGYCVCSPGTHRGIATRLALTSHAQILMLDYRLAPEHPFPAALEDTLTAFHWLLGQGIQESKISIGGDSAGGGLSLAAAMTLRDAGLALPEKLFLLSPWTDLTLSGASIRSKMKNDPILNGGNLQDFVSAYIGNKNPTNPLISPLFGNLQGLPPVLIHVGSDEILLDDSIKLAAHLRSAGVPVELEIWEGMWHVFQIFAPFLPESQLSLQKIGEFL